MYKLICISTILLVNCKNNSLKNKYQNKDSLEISKSVFKDSVIYLPKSKLDRQKYHTNMETIRIYAPSKSIEFSKNEFNDIIDNFPELYDNNINSPDSTFSESSISVDLIDSLGNKKHLSFGSEAGQDSYYILYAYFLKHKNGISKYKIRRKNLREIYITLNSIFGTLNNGGTYYGHQYNRIEGYAEFSIYWYRHYEDYFDRNYDIKKQKKLYIAELKQLILDEEKIDSQIYGLEEKMKRRKKIFKDVNKLEYLITDNFYLRMAKSFQSDHY
jgi:hypothetical protein